MAQHRLGIDVATRDRNKLQQWLGRLKSTMEIENGGMYHQCPEESQLWITTTMSQKELEDWLYRVNHGCDYTGVFSRELTKETQPNEKDTTVSLSSERLTQNCGG